MTTQPHWPCPNNCMTWCRDDVRVFGTRVAPMPNHHPRCEHVNASLIDVWRIHQAGMPGGMILDNEEEAARFVATERAADSECDLEITKQQMHREVYEQLEEFAGF